MRALPVLWLVTALACLACGCNRTDVADDDEPPVNVVRPKAIVTDTSNVAVPLTNVPGAANAR